MFRKLTVLLVLVVLGFSAGTALAAFDNTMASPRARGMGDSGVAVPDGAYATVLNPGHLATAPQYGVAASYVRPLSLNFTDHYHFGAVMPLENAGGIGLSLTQFKVDYEDTKLLEESRVSLGYGQTLYTDYHSSVDIGVSLNMYHLKMGETISGINPGSDTAFGIDMGMVFTLHKRTRLAFLAQNLNNVQIGIDDEELERRLVAGISYEPYDGVITTFEIDNELGQDVQYQGGAEMVIVPGFALRAGIITNPNKLTAGFGYTFKGASIIYGFSSGGGTLESTHQFGVNFAWGGEAQ